MGVTSASFLEVDIYQEGYIALKVFDGLIQPNVWEVRRRDLEKLRGLTEPTRDKTDTESWQPFKIILTGAYNPRGLEKSNSPKSISACRPHPGIQNEAEEMELFDWSSPTRA